MKRPARNSLYTILAILCVGYIMSGAGLRLSAFNRAAPAQDHPVARTIDGPDAEVLAKSRGEREALIQTDKFSYERGEVMIVTGSGFDVGETVILVLRAKPAIFPDRTVSVVADAFGNIFDNQFKPEGPGKGVTFFLTARGESSGLSTQRVLANPSADLDQWANLGTTGSWVNGNLGASKALYHEGDNIPYRLRFGNLSLDEHAVTIEWDTTKSSKHALDYLTTYNYRVPLAVPIPCDFSACSGFGTPDLFAIPKDPQVDNGSGGPPPGFPIPQAAGNFTMYGGDITSVGTSGSEYSYSPAAGGFIGDTSARITITFTATVPNPVLAWGGHISTRQDWGNGSSAVAVPGSPYHTRLLDLDGSGGNQDRSLSAAAVIFPASITVVKACGGATGGPFAFTQSGNLSPASYNLNCAGQQAFSGIEVFQNYDSVEASLASGWTRGTASCAITDGTGNGGSTSPVTDGVRVSLAEGENWTCTFNNTAPTPTPTPVPPTPTPTPVPPTPTPNTPDICTTQDIVPKDTATISGATSDVSGAITFDPYPPSNPNCSGNGVVHEVVDVTGNGSYSTTTTYHATVGGLWKWKFSYSGDAHNVPVNSACGVESFDVVNTCSPPPTPTPGLGPFLHVANSRLASSAVRAKPQTNWLRLLLVGIP